MFLAFHVYSIYLYTFKFDNKYSQSSYNIIYSRFESNIHIFIIWNFKNIPIFYVSVYQISLINDLILDNQKSFSFFTYDRRI